MFSIIPAVTRTGFNCLLLDCFLAFLGGNMRLEAKLQGQLDYEACYLRYQCPFFSIQSKEWLPQPNFWRLLLSRRLFGPGESSHPKRAETSRDSQDGAPSHRALCAPRNPSRKSPFASAKISAALAMLRQSLAPVRLGSVPALNTLQKKSFLPACRPYSVAAHPISDLNASTVTVENASSPKNLTPSEKLVFGHTFTGEFYCDWD